MPGPSLARRLFINRVVCGTSLDLLEEQPFKHFSARTDLTIQHSVHLHVVRRVLSCSLQNLILLVRMNLLKQSQPVYTINVINCSDNWRGCFRGKIGLRQYLPLFIRSLLFIRSEIICVTITLFQTMLEYIMVVIYCGIYRTGDYKIEQLKAAESRLVLVVNWG